MIDYGKKFIEIDRELQFVHDPGEVATYIPELGHVPPHKFGVHLITTSQRHFSYGDAQEKFSIQSVAKVLSLTLAYQLEEERLWERVGVEPSGTAFNSLVQLEYDLGIPRNPFINAGALVVCDVLVSHLKDPKKDFLAFAQGLAANPGINYSTRIAQSEKITGFRNAALINLMKSFGNIHNDIDVVLDFYFHLCSIEMTCEELAGTFLFLAANGRNPFTQQRIISTPNSKRINAVMLLCGFYDEAGEFAFKVGLPGKSGVGGGIIAIHPNKYSIGLWSPRLNKKGNSFKGMKFLELLTSKTRSSIF